MLTASDRKREWLTAGPTRHASHEMCNRRQQSVSLAPGRTCSVPPRSTVPMWLPVASEVY